VLAVVLPGAAGAADATTTLTATVGPGFTISLTDQAGARVTNLSPGTYVINVQDRAAEHNFHLTGPGVDQATAVETTGDTTWTVTVRDGTYTYVCDPHSSQMRGSFTVGAAAPPPAPPAPAPTPPPPPPAPAAAKPLAGSVGPGFTISLRSAGKLVGTLKAGLYAITVRDRAAIHNFHLIGPGVNRRTSVPGVGTTTWRLRLRPGLYRFVCDPHARSMRGSFRVTA
jgi:plastocyanin